MMPYYKNELTTIYNGDCLEVMDYLIEQGIKFDAIITDPPYGTTACKWDNVIPFDKMWERLNKLRKEKAPVVLFGAEPFSSYLRISNIKEFKYDWVWDKVLAVGHLVVKHRPLAQHEIISVFGKGTINYYPLMIKRDNPRLITKKKGSKTEQVNYIQKENYSKISYEKYPKTIITESNAVRHQHSTQKPLELLSYLIKTYTKENDLILDFTSGSFTTCVAAEQLGRRSIGIELEQKYCDIGIKRLNNLQVKFDI